MTRGPGPTAIMRALTTALTTSLRRLGLALLAAVLVSFVTATVLVVASLVIDGADAWRNAPYAWTGVFALALAFGLPAALMFGVLVAPVAALAGRLHRGWSVLTSALGGGALVLITTSLSFAVLGVLGGLTYAKLEEQVLHRRRTQLVADL
ncbi:hypothetical protein GCM10008955_37190 [Deinococcus malanensis]|uniref:ABC transporter permease n=1 Tax=Deinococcus malanensis TaxID=1706855 RepID=A0ABQ2F4J0_9DEIO|nr:hypothetical protein [Deinococcus malanensis]GGK39939.1 hypothetical protein GCM10008955_37190 [Deinococcus malanensis]